MISDIVDKIIKIPQAYKADNKSAYALLKESGYFENYEDITVDLLKHELIKKPEVVDDWLLWSADKRSNGWYILEDFKDGHQVGAYVDKEWITEKRYTDLSEACAHFIKMEIEDIRKIK